MQSGGFEPPPRRLGPKPSALDHSATIAPPLPANRNNLVMTKSYINACAWFCLSRRGLSPPTWSAPATTTHGEWTSSARTRRASSTGFSNSSATLATSSPRTRSIGRARGGARARGRARARKGIISPRARAVYPRAREGNGVERGERRGDARGGVVCRRCLALERERWEVEDEDER